MKYDCARVVHRVMADSTALALPHHGPQHWLNVASMGHRLAEAEGVDPLFCEIFGLLHDCQRLEDGHDPYHGDRAAEYAKSIGTLLCLGTRKFKKLIEALTWHDDQVHHPDVQIGCCWDADRLDLPRVGIRTDPRYLNTETAKRIARRRR